MKKRILVIIGLLLMSLLVATTVFLYGSYKRVTVKSSAVPIAQPQTIEEDHFHNNQPYGLVLLGYGGGTHEGGRLTDSIMVVQIIPKEEKIVLLSLPRDLWVPLAANGEEKSFWKINAAYAIGSDDRKYPHKPEKYKGEAGGGEMAKDAVALVTGLPIHHFVSLNFFGFKKTIDVLGGVNVKVEKTFDDPQYPLEGKEDDTCGKSPEEMQALLATVSAELAEKEFPCRYELLHFDKGVTKMNGETALKFARSRHSAQDGNDFGRAARQRNVLLAVKDRVLALDFFPKIIPFISSLAGNLQTDLTLADMETFLKYKNELLKYSVVTLTLTDKNVFKIGKSADGQSIVMPREGIDQWDAVHQWIEESIKNASPSATASSSSKIVAPTPNPKAQ
jgi:anionic cell wall polymer biosynthesis LytR-Cps2A-Psr (LCP) family protein